MTPQEHEEMKAFIEMVRKHLAKIELDLAYATKDNIEMMSRIEEFQEKIGG